MCHNINEIRNKTNGHIDKYRISPSSVARIKRNRGEDEIGQDIFGFARTITCSIPKITTFDNYIKINEQTESITD